jgi:hypothetical protein
VEKKEKRHFYLIKKIKIMKWGRRENKKLKMEGKANGVGYGGGTGKRGRRDLECGVENKQLSQPSNSN